MHVDSERWVGKYPRGKFFQAICSLRIQINTRHLGLGSGEGEGQGGKGEGSTEEKDDRVQAWRETEG